MLPSLSSPGRLQPPLSLLLLLLPLLLLPFCSTANGLCDSQQLRAILRDTELPSCLASSGKTVGSGSDECSTMRHFEEEAQRVGESLDQFMSRASVVIFAHSEYAKDMLVPGNPMLDLATQLAGNRAYIAVTKCLKATNSTCQQLRQACFGGFVSHFAFMVSGHCSKSWSCSPIYTNEKSLPSSVMSVLPYLYYRLIEQQAYIAKERGELQLSTSTTTEYLIQTELNDTYGSQLVSKSSLPVAMFVAEPTKTMAYYQQLAWFLEAALRLKHLFAFHVVVTPLSQLKAESERPPYRWKLEEHQSFMAIYTKKQCSSSPTWVFTCKPLIATGRELLLAEQYTSLMLHAALGDASLAGMSYPTLNSTTEYLKAFVRESTSYALAVVPVEEMLTDPMVRWDALTTLTLHMGSSFGITYHPVILSKSVALQVLSGLDTGLVLEQTFYHPSLFIRLPTGAYAALRIDEPIAILDKTVRDVSQDSSYQMMIQSTQDMFNQPDVAELPAKMIRAGHIIKSDVPKAEDDFKEMANEVRLKNRTDAFSEQVRFKEVYNVTGVMVIETNPDLMRNFFARLGQDKPWLVLFTVSWSPVSKAARAVWSAVGQCARRMGFPDVQLVKVDCFEANVICGKLNITTYPTVSMFSRGVHLNTYSGPITSNDLCLYVKLAFELPVIGSKSEQATKQALAKLLALKSRAFILRGPEMPSQLAALAKALRFREVFMHEKVASGQPQLTAVYQDVKPDQQRYTGPLDDASQLLDFVENGHLGSVFPCTWNYLPQALRRDRPLAILFHTDAASDDSASLLLERLHARFADRASLCHLNLRQFTHMSNLVNRLAGLSLPALVALTQPPGASERATQRLALGTLPAGELLDRAADWLERALSHSLGADAVVRPVEPQEKWQPVGQVFNFVDQVYHGKTEDPGQRHHGSRPFNMDASSPAAMGTRDEDVSTGRPGGMMGKSAPPMMAGGDSMRDEL